MMKVSRSGFFRVASAGGWLAIAGALGACQTSSHTGFESVDTTVSPVEEARLILPPGFLYTDHEPLERWLTERFDVEYRNMTPDLMFDQVPIDQIHYELRGLAEDLPLFHLKDSSLSRREILFKIADFWDLDMRIENDASGNPSVVVVTSK